MKIVLNPDDSINVSKEEFFNHLKDTPAFELRERYSDGSEYEIDHMDVCPAAKFTVSTNGDDNVVWFNYDSITFFESEAKEMHEFTNGKQKLTFFYSYNSDELWGHHTRREH